MGIVKVYDFRHYERKKGPGTDHQPPTAYGEVSATAAGVLLRRRMEGATFNRVVTSPQPRAANLPGFLLTSMPESTTDDRLNDMGSDPTLQDFLKVVKVFAKEHGLSVEHAFFLLEEGRRILFDRALGSIQAIGEVVRDVGQGNVLLCRHGGVVEATAILLNLWAEFETNGTVGGTDTVIPGGYDLLSQLGPKDLQVGTIGGPLATCEGVIQTWQVEEGRFWPSEIEVFRLPKELKDLEHVLDAE